MDPITIASDLLLGKPVSAEVAEIYYQVQEEILTPLIPTVEQLRARPLKVQDETLYPKLQKIIYSGDRTVVTDGIIAYSLAGRRPGKPNDPDFPDLCEKVFRAPLLREDVKTIRGLTSEEAIDECSVAAEYLIKMLEFIGMMGYDENAVILQITPISVVCTAFPGCVAIARRKG